jgi:type IV secretion system protein VirB5
MTLRKELIAASVAVLLSVAPLGQAAMPVVDVAALARLATQIRTMQDHLTTARNTLSQAQQAFTSMTGSRGMERLLGNTIRNYLPADFGELEQAIRDGAGAYQALSNEVRATLNANSVLRPQDLTRWSPLQRDLLTEQRQQLASRQAITRQALGNTSQRFAALQQLIDAIGSANDPKAVMDLQARIAAENAMLANERSKLEVLQQLAVADEAAQRQKLREQAMADVGSLRNLAPMGLR